MARKKAVPRPRKIPQRMCVACRQAAGKRQLIRVVRTPDGVRVDPSGKMAGRGAYLHPRKECWAAALDNNLLGRALRTKIGAEDLAELREYAAALPEGDDVAPGQGEFETQHNA